jgi:putative ABC transport system permease protein
MMNFLQDLRYGARTLARQPGFTLIAIITLALGIGANTAIFSIVNGVLLRPLPYSDPQRVVTVLQEGQSPLSPANFLDLRAQSTSFESMAAAEAWGGGLTGGDKPEEIAGLRMGDGLFQLLGVQPMLGRALDHEDFQPGKDHVLVLSHKLWQRSFGGDPGIVGRQLQLDRESYTVVGVMPPQFQFPPFWATRAEMWAPLDLTDRATRRGGSSLRVFGRLSPGVSLTQAQAEVGAISRRLEQGYPDMNAGLALRVDPLIEKVVGKIRPALLVLLAAVACVLLIAAANVAGLLMVRGASRQREFAIRTALGATRMRTIRQLLTESVLLGVLGGAAGLALAIVGLEWITTLLAGNASSFSVRLPRLNEIGIDRATLFFTLVVSLLSSVVFGLAPAVETSKLDLNQMLKEGGRGAAGGRRRLRETLVVIEVATAFVLLVGAGLLLNSFVRLQAIDPGFNPRNVLTMIVSLSGESEMVGPRREDFYRELTQRIEAIPGVESASAVNHLPLAGDKWGVRLAVEGRPIPRPGEEIKAVFRVSRPGYLKTMGIPLLQGRDFTDRDAKDAPGVVIVNETLARHQWPDEEPVGKRITLDNPQGTPQWLAVIGVVKDVKQDSWAEAPSNEIYIAFQQSRGFFSGLPRHYASMTLVIRTRTEPRSLIPTVENTVRTFDRDIPVSSVASMEDVIGDAIWQPRFNVLLIGLFAATAVLLASIGLYGVLSYSVTQRTREIGVRLALGAPGRDVLGLVVKQGMKVALIGLSIGLAGAFALTRLMASLLYGVSATDPVTFAGIGLLLTAVALLACYLPARRASRVDPVVALRCE